MDAGILEQELDSQKLILALNALKNGDFSVRLPNDWTGKAGKIADTFNQVVERNQRMARELERLGSEVGVEGKIDQRANIGDFTGSWAGMVSSVNTLVEELVRPTSEMSRVVGAVAKGDLSQTAMLEVGDRPLKGEFFKTARTVNTMVDLLNSFTSEVTRVAREVGTEGKLGGQATVKGLAGIWKDLTDNVNSMASNLTGQVRNIAEVTIAVANGDLSKKITVDVRGEILQLKETINTMVDQLRSFASEVTRVAREVGTEGKLGGQAVVPGVAGTWKDLTDNVNSMAGNLTGQVRNIAEVTTAVARGDLSRKITVDVRGEILQLKETINTMVDQLNSFAGEVTRVAREVGTEGKLGGQAAVPGVGGTWKDLTDSVNIMAGNLTGQVRNIAEVTIAVANGDLSKKITADVRGEILQLKETINTMVDQLRSFASEVTRVAREVGTEGKLGGQALVPGVAGTWKDLTDSVNFMAGNLTSQVRNIADVTTAVAKGDLSRKITVDVKGEILELKNTINTMVDQLSSFASEVTRVAREVGTEGKLGGQAQVPGVAGTWKDLTDNVNSMAGNLTGQVRNIAEVTTAVANGDLSKKITADVRGEILRLKETINTMVEQLRSFASEVTRVAREVGTEGKLGGQAVVPGVAGTWKDLTDNVNSMAGNLTAQVRNIAEVTTAVAKGDLSKKITADVSGEILQLKETINTMVDQLSSFASEVTRVAREVGTEGKLGGQARVPGVAGTWKDLTDNVNFMAGNLTGQVRNIADVTTAVAKGDLSRKITVDVKGEILELKNTINTMVDQLSSFASEVTRVAREVGTEGKLGGQAQVPGVAGTWKDLTDNVNQLAANLTTQVRSIAEVATAVTKGDLTRSIRVEASGEVETLKDTINQMIANLRATTQKNADQDWLKTNLAHFTRMLQGQRDLQTVSSSILTELSKVVSARFGAFYIAENKEAGDTRLRLLSAFANRPVEALKQEMGLGEGLVGECARNKERILVTDVPDNYIKISSGLGEAKPANIVVLPTLFEGQMKAVLELAAFEPFNLTQLAFLDQLVEVIGIVLNNLEATLRTETLLKSLQHQQEELRRTNQALEEKADQLALTSKYKSEFLSNMSHELRTPLNSMLILSQQLAEDSGSLTQKQIEYAKTIHASGGDLLALINDILDLSKVESGTMTLELNNMPFTDMRLHLERVFRHVAEGKGLKFEVEFDPNTPEEIYTDGKRLEQILRNLLSNAFKFTEKGRVSLRVAAANSGWTADHPVLSKSDSVIAFTVSDSGIGIPRDKQKIIFEAFQQAESGTSRKYGGTGLGLSISRELAKLLGGQLILASSVQSKGSTFVLYLPTSYSSVGAAHTETEKPEESAPFLLNMPYRLANRFTPDAVEPKADMIEDDRGNIQSGDQVLLIIEDEPSFARILVEAARQKGFKAVAAVGGDAALRLANEIKPSAVTLDIRLPDIEGWRLLARFKNDPHTRHIPVQIISANEDRLRGMQEGAVAFFSKPVSKEEMDHSLDSLMAFCKRPSRNLLVLDGNAEGLLALRDLLGGGEVAVTGVKTAEEALEALKKESFDCMVLASDRESIGILKALKRAAQGANVPIVVYLDHEPTKKEEEAVRLAAKAHVIKEVKSLERLFDETALYLHRSTARLPEEKRRLVEKLHQPGQVMVDKKALVVDDDMRNIFAMTSLLERNQMTVVSAESGKEALEVLDKNPDVDVVLMDIMMPEMDGYDTMKAIRQKEEFRSLPIIALTAKAMKGDREKCIEMGASDYITKPIDSDQLLSLMRNWLYR